MGTIEAVRRLEPSYPLLDDGWAIFAPAPGLRDLARPEYWDRSLERSLRRRRAAAARRPGVPKGAAAKLSAALLATTVLAPASQLARAQGVTATATSASFDLHLGSRGPKTAAAQRALGISADGVFGHQTRRAVRAFQAAHGLAADGVVGPLTAAALGLTGTAHAATSSSLDPATTLAVQRALGVAADGEFGPITRAAVRAFQQAHGLEVDGVVGPQTRAALGLDGSGAASTAATPDSGESTTAALQRALGISADGVYGPMTRAAVRSFQQAHGLEVDGVAGPATLAAAGLGSAAPIPAATLMSSSSSSSASAPSSAAGAAIAAARSMLGVPYATAGTGPGGFDCSGLTQWAMGQAGVSLPRTSYDQFGVGSAVDRAAIQPGDLVFFNTSGGGASHVGIATSNGTVISATTHGVMEHSISDAYWGSHYVGARRVA